MPNPNELQDLAAEKLARLRKARIIETDEARKFQLDQQIKEAERELAALERQIEDLAKPAAKKTETRGKSERKPMPWTKRDGVIFGLIFTAIFIGFTAYLLTHLGSAHGLARQYGDALIFLTFGAFSLIAAIVLFGFLRSTGVFKTTKAQFGGAAAVFMATLGLLIGSYLKTRPVDSQVFVVEGLVYVDNKPVTGARVQLLEAKASALTEDGKFELKLYEPEKRAAYTFRVTFARADSTFAPVAHEQLRDIVLRLTSPPVTDPPPDTGTVEQPLRPTITLTATVLDHNLNPIGEATVIVTSAGQTIRTTTSANGRFTLTIEQPRATYKVEVTVAGYAVWEKELQPGDVLQKNITLE